MCKRKKKIVEAPKREMTPEEALDYFELKKPAPAYDPDGNRDYFAEYYQAYKNDYIDQYLEAYKKFKNEGAIPHFSHRRNARREERTDGRNARSRNQRRE